MKKKLMSRKLWAAAAGVAAGLAMVFGLDETVVSTVAGGVVSLCSLVRDIFAEKGINVWVDVWGHDVNHDWPWWYKQAAYHIDHVL